MQVLQVTLNNSRPSAVPIVPILGFHRQTKKRESRSNNQQVKKQRFKKMNLVSIGNSWSSDFLGIANLSSGSSCIPFLYGWKIDCAWGGLVTVLFSAQLLSFSLLRLVERLGISIQERESQAVKLAVTIVWGVKSHACTALWSRLQEFIAKLKSGNATSGNKKISVWGKMNK